jgi:hypothetical protein
MSHSEKTLDYLEQKIPSLSAAAVEVAYWQALAAGQKVLVKASEKPLSLPVGTRVKIA